MIYFKNNEDIIELVAKKMKEGKIAIFPTETVYGIGTSAFKETSCKRIYEIKKRPYHKPLIVLVSDEDMLFEVIESVNELERKLIERFWPGPLTIIFEKKKNGKLADSITCGDSSVGVRMTDGKVARMLIEEGGVPIVAPSANLSGNPSGTKIKEIVEELGDEVDYILDYGDIEDDTTSTIVKVENDGIHVLRQGRITNEQLKEIDCNLSVDL